MCAFECFSIPLDQTQFWVKPKTSRALGEDGEVRRITLCELLTTRCSGVIVVTVLVAFAISLDKVVAEVNQQEQGNDHSSPVRNHNRNRNLTIRT